MVISRTVVLSDRADDPFVNHRILIADDEPDMLELVSSSFATAGFMVLKASDGKAALSDAQREKPSLIVLDIMMPGLTGLEVTRALKRDAATSSIPIMLLSARTQEIDRILGFELGADDFVTKPFSPRELVLRAASILRRKSGPASEVKIFRVGTIEVDEDRHIAKAQRREVTLTAIEFKLLLALARVPGRVQSRDDLLNLIWGLETPIEVRTVDTHIRRLRDKLGAAGQQIHTVRGFGYRLDEE
jgi:two-component system, OmpR family, phosphate regulon response regulator PhoB